MSRRRSVVRLLSQPEVEYLDPNHRAYVAATTQSPYNEARARRNRANTARNWMTVLGRGLRRDERGLLPRNLGYTPHGRGMAREQAEMLAREVAELGPPQYNVPQPAPPETYVEYDRRGRPKSVCDRFTNMCYSIGSFFRGGTRRVAKRSKKYSRKNH